VTNLGQAISDLPIAVPLPTYLAPPLRGYVTRLSTGTKRYDYARSNGRQNIGWWIDAAAKAAGR
jgi:hypothetical protein